MHITHHLQAISKMLVIKLLNHHLIHILLISNSNNMKAIAQHMFNKIMHLNNNTNIYHIIFKLLRVRML